MLVASLRFLVLAVASGFFVLGSAWIVAGAEKSFDSGLLDSGGSYELTFDNAGVFEYHCKPHQWMQGTVTVVDGAGGATHSVAIVEPNATDIDSWGYDPANLEVQAGDTVVWTNMGNTSHTVTGSGEFESNGAPAVGVALVGIGLLLVVAVLRRHGVV